MTVPSLTFLAFAAIVAAVINISNATAWRRGVLLVANVSFVLSFAAREPASLLPFGVFLALGFASMKLMERQKRSLVFGASVLTVLLLFCWLKQYSFIPHSVALNFPYFTVGMSYVFFRVMHLLIDSYEDTLPTRLGAISYFNYTCNFTSLVAGPIQYYRDYLRTESEQPLRLDSVEVQRGLNRIITGFFKVSVLSPFLFSLHERYTAPMLPGLPLAARVADGAAILVVFPAYLYVNFSGYTDFVIGVGRFLRLQLPENFNKPYLSRSFLDLWTRWHITLSSWLKTYVYSPLLIALMRRAPTEKLEPWFGVFAYFVTFFLVGAWHGQTSMFLFFGVLQGLGVSLNKLYQIFMIRNFGRLKYRAICANRLYDAASRGLTFVYLAITVLWFWSTWSELRALTQSLGAGAVMLAFLLVFLISAIVLPALQSFSEAPTWANIVRAFTKRGYFRVAWLTALVVITLSVTVVLNAPAPRIVYKGF